MLKFLITLLVITALIAIWVTIVRPWLRQKPSAQPFFAAIEPVELWLYKKSETILWARFKMLVGVVLTTLTQIQVIDITPLMPFVPSGYEQLVKFGWNMIPMLITVLGIIDESLRNDTTQPIETVALTEADKAKPEVAVAIAKLDEAKVEAVAVVKSEEAKEDTKTEEANKGGSA